jgi:hypothetical protein
MLECSQIRPFSHACTPGTGTSRLKILCYFKLLPDQPATSFFAFLTGILHSSYQWLHSWYRSWEVDEAVPGGCHWSAILWGSETGVMHTWQGGAFVACYTSVSRKWSVSHKGRCSNPRWQGSQCVLCYQCFRRSNGHQHCRDIEKGIGTVHTWSEGDPKVL